MYSCHDEASCATPEVVNQFQTADDQHSRIEAHGGQFLQAHQEEHTNTWYWIGEGAAEYAGGASPTTSKKSINCYRSEHGLAGPWRKQGTTEIGGDGKTRAKTAEIFNLSWIQNWDRFAFQPAVSDRAGPITYKLAILERPKILYNEKNREYVMWFHLENASYEFHGVGIARSKHLCGASSDWELVTIFQPHGMNSNDFSVFKDPVNNSQDAYLINAVDNRFAAISKMDENYYGILEKSYSRLKSTDNSWTQRLEGLAIFYQPPKGHEDDLSTPGGRYWILASHLTYYDPNPLVLLRGERGKSLIQTAWEERGNPTSEETSFNSQPAQVVTMGGNVGKNGGGQKIWYLYLADNWVHGGRNCLREVWDANSGTWNKVQVRGTHWDNATNAPAAADDGFYWCLRQAGYVMLPFRVEAGRDEVVLDKKDLSGWDLKGWVGQ